jgi:hypothetical protein
VRNEAKISDGDFTTNSLCLRDGLMTAFQPMLQRTVIRPCGASRRIRSLGPHGPSKRRAGELQRAGVWMAHSPRKKRTQILFQPATGCQRFGNFLDLRSPLIEYLERSVITLEANDVGFFVR